jgi:hypothetical protein
MGSVDCGQSIVRPTTTASLLLFQRARVQAKAGGNQTQPKSKVAKAPLTIFFFMEKFL